MTDRRPLTDREREQLDALNECTFLPGSWDKRFVRDAQHLTEVTPTQAEWIAKLAWRYRRQLTRMGRADLVHAHADGMQ